MNGLVYDPEQLAMIQAGGYPSPAAYQEAMGTAPWLTQPGIALPIGLRSPEGVIQQPQLPGASPPGGVVPGDISTYPVMAAGMNPFLQVALGAGVGWLSSQLFGDAGQEVLGAVTSPGGTGATIGSTGSGSGVSIPLVGPGVPEPPNSIVKSRWETRVYDNRLGYVKINFYALTDGRIAMYHNYKKYWKVWRPRKNIVISSDPRMSNIKKLDRVHGKVVKALKKIVPKVRVTSRQAPSRFLSAVERKELG